MSPQQSVDLSGSQHDGSGKISLTCTNPQIQSLGLACDLGTMDLTAREFVLLELFLRYPGQVLSHEQILSQRLGIPLRPRPNIVDVYVRALRKKLGADCIGTVGGMGYRVS